MIVCSHLRAVGKLLNFLFVVTRRCEQFNFLYQLTYKNNDNYNAIYFIHFKLTGCSRVHGRQQYGEGGGGGM